jgi:serine/threonine protein kinase
VTLANGTKLDAYEILAPLGAGGMGEVYRARDHKLQRDVAVKVLPARLSEDGAVLARFEREARAVAALSQPGGSARAARSPGASRELLPRGTVATAFNWLCRISRDNRVLTFRHDTYEGDVWLMTLD